MDVDNELLLLLQSEKIEKAKKEFWHFCNAISPDYYNKKKWHLKELCNKLQQFYFGELKKQDGTEYTNLIIQMPPRHGKSRTLTNYSAWILGLDRRKKIICASYSDDLASDFSKNTRNIIMAEKATIDIVYSDIFPKTKIKYGDASLHKWAVEGTYFSYKGTGIGGSITGRGGDILIIDDSVQSAKAAFSENYLNDIWLWYTGTWLSRQESKAKKIVCETAWAKNDLTGRLQNQEKEDWYIVQFEIWNEKQGMLSEEDMSFQEYQKQKKSANEKIFLANYHNIRIDSKGAVYGEFKTYYNLPGSGEIVAYCDTADTGEDYLCLIIAKKYMNYLYIINVYLTQDAQEKTEPETARLLIKNKVQKCVIESNTGGRAFRRNVERILGEQYKWFGTIFQDKNQHKNKEVRITSMSTNIANCIIMPMGWETQLPIFYQQLMNYNRIKNIHDDAPDALTGLYEEFIENEGEGLYIIPNVI